MSKVGRSRRTAEQQVASRTARTVRGNEVRAAWVGLAKIADKVAEKSGVSKSSARQKRQ